jgi:hypothetical protein
MPLLDAVRPIVQSDPTMAFVWAIAGIYVLALLLTYKY